MKRFRYLFTTACILAAFVATANELLTADAKGPGNHPAAPELKSLQGTWEGLLVGDQARQLITIKIIGDSLHFHRDTNFWFETTITLPAGKVPTQLHATIKASPPSQGASIGQVVRAIFQIEKGTLTLITIGDDEEDTPKSFEAAGGGGQTRYELRKVQPKPKPNNIPPTLIK